MLPIQVIVKYCTPKTGGEGVAYRFCEYLQTNNIPFSLICGRNKTSDTPFADNIVRLGMLRPSRLLKYSSFFHRASKYIQQHKGIAFSFEYVVGAQILRMTGVHNTFLEKSLEGMSPRAQKKKQRSRACNLYNYYLPWQEKCTVTNPALRQIITPSSMTQDEICSAYPFTSDKISVIHNGVNKSRFRPPTREEKNAARSHFLPKNNATTIIGFAGNNFERKGLSHCIASLKELPDAVLLVAGSDSITKYAQQARKDGVEDRVIFLGHQNDITQFFNALDVFCLPTRYDPFGFVIGEAIASGVPVVASSHAGGAEIINSGVSGLVCSKFEDRVIADAIRKAANISAENIHTTVPSEADMFADYVKVAEEVIRQTNK